MTTIRRLRELPYAAKVLAGHQCRERSGRRPGAAILVDLPHRGPASGHLGARATLAVQAGYGAVLRDRRLRTLLMMMLALLVVALRPLLPAPVGRAGEPAVAAGTATA
ncbi:hypothetical protein FraQA3DRAFT_2028 [Frankia sp. QA3]|nr:hypothetical protein FraQA3DRAFT_2028 [Frankia sp. QA3]